MKETARYLITMSRPRFWLYLAGPALLGIVYGAGSVSSLVAPLPILMFLYFLVPANVFLYGINDYFDKGIDAVNPKKEGKEARYQEGGPVAGWVIAFSGLLTLGLFPLAGDAGTIAFGMFIFLAITYSAPPLRFKTTPFLDSLSNGLYILPGVVTYAMMTGTLPPGPVIVGGWLWSMAMHTFSAIPDIGPDREAGIGTTATFLGHESAMLYCFLAWTGAAAVTSLVSIYLGLLLAVYPVLVAVWRYVGADIETVYWYYPYINAIMGMIISVPGFYALAV